MPFSELLPTAHFLISSGFFKLTDLGTPYLRYSWAHPYIFRYRIVISFLCKRIYNSIQLEVKQLQLFIIKTACSQLFVRAQWLHLLFALHEFKLSDTFLNTFIIYRRANITIYEHTYVYLCIWYDFGEYHKSK